MADNQSFKKGDRVSLMATVRHDHRPAEYRWVMLEIDGAGHESIGVKAENITFIRHGWKAGDEALSVTDVPCTILHIADEMAWVCDTDLADDGEPNHRLVPLVDLRPIPPATDDELVHHVEAWLTRPMLANPTPETDSVVTPPPAPSLPPEPIPMLPRIAVDNGHMTVALADIGGRP